MTIEAIEFTAVYTVSGTGPYAIPHGYRSGTDIVVSVLDAGLWVDLSPSSYVISPDAATDGGGVVTLTDATATQYQGETIRLLRTTAIEQGWKGQTAREVGLEAQLDVMTMAIQDLFLRAASSFAGPVSDLSFPDLASFQAWVATGEDVVLADGTVVQVGAVQWQKAGAEATPGIVDRWLPAHGKATPFHFAGQPLINFDNTAAVNAAIAFAASSWGPNQAFAYIVDLMFCTWRCWGSVNFTGVRQPGLTMANGQIHSHAAGKIAVDGCLTNKGYLRDVQIYGDPTDKPTVGIYVGRGKLNNKFPAAASFVFEGSTGSNGKFRCAAMLNFASEVSCMGDAPLWDNKHRSLKAVSVALINHMQTAEDWWGPGVIQSDYQTLPTPADGPKSNICHHLGQAHFMRNADYNLDVVGITLGPQTVLQIAQGTLAAAEIEDGDQVYLTGGDTVELDYSVFTATNVDEVNDTIELQGVDSTGFTPYTDGATLQNRTGPAMLVAGAKSVTSHSGFLFSLGSPAIVFDMDNGTDVADWDFRFQAERFVSPICQFIANGGTKNVTNFEMRSHNYSQVSHHSVFSVNGDGVIAIDGGCLIISNMAEAPSSSVLDQEDQFILNDFKIAVPRAAALPDPALIGPAGNQYTGDMVAYDRFPPKKSYVLGIEGVTSLLFRTGGGALTGPGIRAIAPFDMLYTWAPHDGSEVLLAAPVEVTQAELADVNSAINQIGKVRFKMVIDENGAIYTANGTTPTSGWRLVTGGATIIPS